jgi:2-polyprenyl-3-methyl-5-hydroxy-6-metoxy-1,4-benzoquinol methylase
MSLIEQPAPPRAAPTLTPAHVAALAGQLYVDGPWLRRKLQHWRPYICPFELLLPHVPNGATVLDVGCGQGLFLCVLAKLGMISAGVGFDTSEAAIASARRTAERDVDVGSAVDFHYLQPGSWPDGTFDVVSMIDVMHHVPLGERRQMIAEACRRVAPGGVFLYKDMCRRPRWRAAMNALHDVVVARQIVRHEEPTHVHRWAAEEGFTLVHAARVNRLWYGHDLCVVARETGAAA